MFTGIIEALGRVSAVAPAAGAGLRLTVDAGADVCEGVKLGDSIAVNGVCLTAVAIPTPTLAFDVIGQTLRRSNLGSVRAGDRVNLERALRVGARLDGHFVQGHVDGVGTVSQRDERPDEVRITIAMPKPLTDLCIPRGSISLDGVSLTIAALADGAVTVALIPHTLGLTTFGQRRGGDSINVEIDLLGKHVARLLGKLPPDIAEPGTTGLTEDRLRELGY